MIHEYTKTDREVDDTPPQGDARYSRLWLSVIERALLDVKVQRDPYIAEDARAFLASDDLVYVCEMAFSGDGEMMAKRIREKVGVVL